MANVTINATGLQENYSSSTAITGSDASITPVGQQVGWQLGTLTTSQTSHINVLVNALSNVISWQRGTPQLQTVASITLIGQQVNWNFGVPNVLTSTNTLVTVSGLQFAYQLGTVSIQESSPSSNPIVIQPGPGSLFQIEGCPHLDTKITVESLCGQSVVASLFKYDHTIVYNAAHTYGAS